MAISSFLARVRNAAEIFSLMGEDEVLHVFSHNDTDGLTSAAIITYLCRVFDKQLHLKTFKQLRPSVIESIERKFSPKEVMFVDFGSGQLEAIINTLKSTKRAVILDHHVPQEVDRVPPFQIVHVNPHHFGFDGDREISSAGICFLLVYTFSEQISVDALFPLAIAGALGDSQLSEEDKLVSLNKLILEKAKERDVLLEKEESLRLFGKEYKPLFKALATTFHPILPGISGSLDAALEFLKETLGEKEHLSALKYSDLTEEERDTVIESLLKRLLFTSEEKNVEQVRERLFGVAYHNKKEKTGRLKDLLEFSAVVNACGRMGHSDIGIRLALGERGDVLKQAISLREENREKVSTLLKKAMTEGRKEGDLFLVNGIKWLDENFASVIASILSSLKREVKVIAVFSHSDEKTAKLSLRLSEEKSDKNLNELVQAAMRNIQGASGGGHKSAAGAYIPYSEMEAFTKNLKSYMKAE